MRTMRIVAGAAVLLAATGLAAAGLPEDDLAVVKKAVASPSPAARRAATPRASAHAAAPASRVEVMEPEPPVVEPERPAPPPRTGAAPQWFKVRVLEKNGRAGRITVNLPLSVVRALGDDWPLPLACGGRHASEHDHACPKLKLSEVLRALEAGQSLVEIDDENATVRVWVE